MSSPHDDTNSPEPATTSGLQDGGAIDPGDTPPTAGSMSGTSPDARKAPNMGPVSGNRTPMFIALGALGVLVLMCALLVGASVFPS